MAQLIAHATTTTNAFVGFGRSKSSVKASKVPHRRACRGLVRAEAATDTVDVSVGDKVADTPVAAPPVQKVKGKTAIVTGGSQGCGKETAMLLAKDGWNVVVLARQPERLDAVAQEVARVAGRAEAGCAIATDISDLASVQAMADEVNARYEDVSLLVNNAGACCTMPFEQTTDEDWDWQMQTNVLGAVRVTRALLPNIRQAKGSIVFVNSFGGVIPLRGMSAYSASKFALAGLAESLRAELSDDGVHVAQVHPGVVNSDFLERAKFADDAGVAQMRKTLDSMPGVQKPEDVANTVMQVVGDRSRHEAVVGAFFQAAVGAYRLTGANPFAAARPNM